jgi:hypothetical protein
MYKVVDVKYSDKDRCKGIYKTSASKFNILSHVFWHITA